MPFGISSALEVFQHCMHQLIERLHGIEVIPDDFMAIGCGDTCEDAMLDHEKLERTIRTIHTKGCLFECKFIMQ